jgi:glycosyltransferase involved in cell wall biosynthesis
MGKKFDIQDMIVYVSDSINSKKNGGSSTSGFEFLQFLRMRYSEVVLITSDPISENELGSEFYNNKLSQINDINIIKRKLTIFNFTLRSLLRPIYYIFKDFRKKKSIDISKYYSEGADNILFINSWSPLFSSEIVKNSDKFKTVCIVRGSPESFIYQSFEVDKKEAVQNAADYLEQFDKLIYVSENGLRDWSKILKNNIESYYLPNSINEYEIMRVLNYTKNELVNKLDLNSNYYNIVIVGSVQKRKAQDILLKVTKDFLRIKPNLRFHIVGVVSKAWGGDEIYNEVINSDYADKFVFHGHSDEVVMYMQAADLLIFTSHAEAFPRTVAEYMALGKPILAADVSGVSEMIKDGENGYLYNSLDPSTLVEAFKKMESNDIEKNRLAKNAYETYWNVFSKKIHISKAIEVFKKISYE